jgi:D-3-phosphoglycerate dehydrogenase
MQLAILDDYMQVALGAADWESVRRRGVRITVFDTAFASVEEAAAKLAPFEIVNLLRERTHFSRALIERLPNLKLIAMTGRRAPSLDLAAATERGILVGTTHGGEGGASTAEMAWTLLLAGARDLTRADRGVRAGRWHEGLRAGVVLEGRRLGLVGLGRLGSRMAGYGKAFGMDVVAWSQNLTPARAAEAGAT